MLFNFQLSTFNFQLSTFNFQLLELYRRLKAPVLKGMIYLLLFAYIFIVARLLGHKEVGVLLAALFFIIVARYKWVFNLSLLVVAVFSTVLSPCMVYGKVSSDLFLNALVADNRHVLEFITTLPIRLFAGVAFVWIAAAILMRRRSHFVVWNKINRIVLLVFAGHLLLLKPVKIYAAQYFKGANEGFSLADFVYKSDNFLLRDTVNLHAAYQEAMEELAKQQRILNARSDWQPKVVDSEFDTYLVVVGESARRDALHSYGFEIANTPFLSSVPKIQFNNYISVGGHTVVSLSNQLVLNYRNNGNVGNNVLSLANSAGFETYWLSNQYEVGVQDSIVAGIGKKSTHYHFLHKANAKNVVQDDTLLLPHIEQALNNKGEAKKVIFVHLYGSHMSFCGRTKEQYDVFHVNKKLSCYVQSIKQTDSLLQAIHQLLEQHRKENHRQWAMVYFSDHGLASNKAEQTILHGDRHKTNYEVPFVVLNSQMTETTYINAQRSALNFFDFFAAWTGIQDDLLPNQCNFISEEPCADSHKVVHNNSEMADYFNLKDEEVNYFRSNMSG